MTHDRIAVAYQTDIEFETVATMLKREIERRQAVLPDRSRDSRTPVPKEQRNVGHGVSFYASMYDSMDMSRLTSVPRRFDNLTQYLITPPNLYTLLTPVLPSNTYNERVKK